MKHTRRTLTGLSFKLDALFFRNLTLILSAVLIWRGMWNFLDLYLFPGNEFLSNIVSIIIGIILLFIFDSEVESENLK